MKNTKANFIKQSNEPARLVNAVIRQVGGWESFRDAAHDVSNYGASSGFSGFIYSCDTVPFFCRNRATIIESLENVATDCGENLLSMIKDFCCLDSEFSEVEIAKVLFAYTKKQIINEELHCIANALAWYALEQVCYQYVSFVESSEG